MDSKKNRQHIFASWEVNNDNDRVIIIFVISFKTQND